MVPVVYMISDEWNIFDLLRITYETLWCMKYGEYIIISTIHFFIVTRTPALISSIRVQSSDCGVALYVQCSTVSSASSCPYSKHCLTCEICFFSKSTHLSEHITLTNGWHGSHCVTHTRRVTQDPYFIWQLLLVTCPAIPLHVWVVSCMVMLIW